MQQRVARQFPKGSRGRGVRFRCWWKTGSGLEELCGLSLLGSPLVHELFHEANRSLCEKILDVVKDNLNSMTLWRLWSWLLGSACSAILERVSD